MEFEKGFGVVGGLNSAIKEQLSDERSDAPFVSGLGLLRPFGRDMPLFGHQASVP